MKYTFYKGIKNPEQLHPFRGKHLHWSKKMSSFVYYK